MLVPCESVVKDLLPALRSKTTRYLYNDYHLSQAEIAQRLGVTQAAVSKYLSAGPTGRGAKVIAADAKLDEVARRLAQEIAVQKVGDSKLSKSVCDICELMSEQKCMARSLASPRHMLA